MKDQESVPAPGSGSVLRVEIADSGASLLEKGLVLGKALRFGVRPVRQQREPQFRVRIGQVVHFQPLHRFPDIRLVGQKHRNDHEGARLGGNAFGELELRETPRADQPVT